MLDTINISLYKRNRGFSLVELMLAMLIGIIILGGVFSLFVTTRDTQRSNEGQLKLIGDARFAIDSIAFDLRHAGGWGANNDPKSIYCFSGDPRCTGSYSPTPATGDCAVGWYTDLPRALIASNGMNPYSADCANKGYVNGTDVLGVKYADSNEIKTADLNPSVVYVRSNVRDGQLFEGIKWENYGQWKFNDVPENKTITTNHLLVGRVYYVSDYTDVVGDGLPSLRRGYLAAGPLFNTEVMVSGVEDFQVQFGIDTTGNGHVDAYVNADKVVSEIGLATNGKVGADGAWGRVATAKIWVLVRSERKDRDSIGGSQIIPAYADQPLQPAYTDGYRRLLLSSVVRIRN